MTASGKAESTEEAAVYVNELDVFVTMVLLEGSPATQSLCLFCEQIGYYYEWKKEEDVSIVVKDGKVTRCKLENNVPFVAFFGEPCIPDVPAKASGDRLRIPSARGPVAQSSSVRCPKPGESSPGMV